MDVKFEDLDFNTQVALRDQRNGVAFELLKLLAPSVLNEGVEPDYIVSTAFEMANSLIKHNSTGVEL